MEHNLLFDAFIYLMAAVISVPIAKQLGMGSVLGYLVAGVLIGQFGLGLVGDQTDVMHFAEFGVVMMLFLVGLELKPSLLWRLRGPILGSGGLQVGLTTLAIMAFAMLFGLIWQQALAIGLILALSSTAIALQSLQEKGLMKTSAGQSSFAVLLFQDIAVIPMLAILPLLAVTSPEFLGETQGVSGWQKGVLATLVIIAIVLAGRFFLNPIFGFIAKSKLREIFTATALLLVIGVALAMQGIGLSPALGTFLAGVVLAESDYRHELETNIEPFKGLLLGLFFISVGASIDFNLLAAQPWLILGLTVGLMTLKFALLFGLGKVTRLAQPDRWLFAFILAQAGEFAFVLFAFASSQGVLPTELIAPLILVVALSMLLTPLLLILNDRMVQPRFSKGQPELDTQTEHLDLEEENPVIIVGFGRFGQAIGRLLSANHIGITVLDHDASQINMVRKYGFKVYYGEGQREEILHAAGAAQAKAIVIAVDQSDQSLQIVHTVKKHFPHLTILARALDRPHAFELIKEGVELIERETLSSGLELGSKTLQALGWRANLANRAARLFKHHDDAIVREMAHFEGDEKAYISQANASRAMLAKALSQDRQWQHEEDEHAWEQPGKLH